MLFAVTCIDRRASDSKRKEMRPAHLAYLDSLGARVRVAGALLDEKGERAIGSLIIFAAADQAEVRALLAADSYVTADLFAAVDTMPWRQAIGASLGS